ncbi:MAG: hypothetical protein R6U84_03250 [Candidatus Cloacimonadales bacterium]
MKKNLLVIILLILSYSFLSAEKYAGEIFRMGAGVENFALGNSGLTNSHTAALAYWNAALLAENQQTRFELMHAEEYHGLLQYDVFSAVYANKFSLVITRIGIDDIPLTAWDDDANRPYVYKNVNTSDLALFLGFQRKILGLNLGISPKMAYRNLADESAFGFGLDLSSYYRISPDWMIAAKIRDLFTTQIFWSTDTRETVLPGLDLESSYQFQIPWLDKSARLIAAIEMLSEDRDFAATHSLGIFSTDYHLGLATKVHQRAELLLGYDVENLTSGLRINLYNWHVNYAFKYNTELDNSHRISLEYKL